MNKLLILSILLSFNAHAAKDFYLFGGGGEKDEKTIFDPQLKDAAPFFNDSNWNSSVIFNGGHSETEEILRSQYKKSKVVPDFSRNNFNDYLDEIEKKIATGKENDQIVIVINTHGARKQKDEKTHYIAFSGKPAYDLRNLKDANVENLDRLKKIVDSATAPNKKMKVAVIDLSCFSGNTLNLNNDKACIISSTGKEQYAFLDNIEIGNDFSSQFLKNLKPGKNLEEIYLQSRMAGSFADFPAINTSAHTATIKKLEHVLAPFQVYDNFRYNDFSNQYITKELAQKAQCQYDAYQNATLQFLDQLTKQFTDIQIHQTVQKLKAEILKYREMQKQYAQHKIDFYDDQQKLIAVEEMIKKDFPAFYQGDMAKNKRRAEDVILSFASIPVNWEMYPPSYEVQKKGEAAITQYKKEFEELVRTEGRIREKALKMLKPGFMQRREDLFRNNQTLNPKLEDIEGISKLSKELYRKIYSLNKSKNPCSDFVL